MTDEEILRKKLDRLNENSYYGIMIDTDITKIVRSFIKRMEEIKMNDIYPLVIVKDRYNGTYSGGKWTAWNLSYVPSKVDEDDIECADFFAKENFIFGRGETPEEAIEDLKHMLVYGVHMSKEYIKEVSESTEDEEENEMKATSKQEIKNIRDISFSFLSCPIEMNSTLTITATTDDDTFEFVFEGEHIIQSCKKAGFFIGWEKDQKIRELDKENKELKAKSKDISDDNALLLATNKKLKEENERNKENLNSQHEMIRELVQKNFKLKEENEQYKEAAERRFNEKLHDFEVNNKKYDGKIMEEILKRNSGRYSFDEEKSSADNVNHPSHYTGKYECIDVMQDVFGDESTNDFCLCNAFKYIWRARKKNGLEDVKKAVWYLNKYIEEAEKDGEDEVTGT